MYIICSKKPDQTIVALQGYGRYDSSNQVTCYWTSKIERNAIQFDSSKDAQDVITKFVRREAYVYDLPDSDKIDPDDIIKQYALIDLGHTI